MAVPIISYKDSLTHQVLVPLVAENNLLAVLGAFSDCIFQLLVKQDNDRLAVDLYVHLLLVLLFYLSVFLTLIVSCCLHYHHH